MYLHICVFSKNVCLQFSFKYMDCHDISYNIWKINQQSYTRYVGYISSKPCFYCLHKEVIFISSTIFVYITVFTKYRLNIYRETPFTALYMNIHFWNCIKSLNFKILYLFKIGVVWDLYSAPLLILLHMFAKALFYSV